MYPGRLPAGLGASGRVSAAEADWWGLLMAREAISLSELFVTSSGFAGDLARLDALPADRHKVAVLPLAFGPPSGRRRGQDGADGDGPVVATFGLVNPTKQTGLVVKAFALVAARHPGATLAVVGPCSAQEEGRLRDLAGRLGLGERMTLTGGVDDDEYAAWLGRATVAVQLRRGSNGETSAATGTCLAVGLATAVSDVGAARDLPDDTVVKVPPEAGPEELAAVVGGLLADTGRREALGRAAAAYAAGRSFGLTAEALLDMILAKEAHEPSRS
jgi:glycosyltransferase involved in cell wall biosynthesis